MQKATIALIVLGLVACADASSNRTTGPMVQAPQPGANTPTTQTPAQPMTPAPTTTPTPTTTPQPTAMAGSAAPMPTTPPPTNTTPPPTTNEPPMPGAGLAMDECGLDTMYPGDEFCINAPSADKGFQMHLGPSNYDNPERQYLMQPGTEITEQVPFTASNTTDVFYYWRQYRMRPGSHHLIINNGARRLGGSSNSAKDNPELGIIAPENEHIGMPLPAHAQLSNSLHYFNFTDMPSLKEAWVNFWYRDPSVVTEPTREIFSMLGMGIAPGQHVVRHGACAISSPGRLLTIYGHVHAHNERFSVYRTRGGNKMLIHDAFDWEHPGISEYSSTVMNPPLNSSAHTDGGYSGIVDLMPGDMVEFDCQILNDTNSIFLGANEAENDEMCILVGDSIGTNIPVGCTQTDEQPTD